jgi:hypothetical protein
VLDLELGSLSAEELASVRGCVRREAAEAEDLLNVVDGPRGAVRSDAIALLVDRLGDDALDVDRIGADYIAQAVVAALRELGIDDDQSVRVAERCREAVLDAGADIQIVSGTLARRA